MINNNNTCTSNMVESFDSTKKIQIIVNDAKFLCSIKMLTKYSIFFCNLLCNNNNDNIYNEEDSDQDTIMTCRSSYNAINIQRSPELFGVLLSYMRNGYLTSNIRLDILAALLKEAEFYGITSLIDEVKTKCIQNMPEYSYLNTSSEEKMKFLFPDLEALLSCPFFPSVLYAKQVYQRIVSTELVNGTNAKFDRVYHVLPVENENDFATWVEDSKEIICYACIEDCTTGSISLQPMVRYHSQLIPWDLINVRKHPCQWPMEATYRTQVLPLSMVTMFEAKDQYNGLWYFQSYYSEHNYS